MTIIAYGFADSNREFRESREPIDRAPLLNEQEIAAYEKVYCCARCWGHLNRVPAPGRLWYAECPTCGLGRGYVTKYWADKRRAESHKEYIQVRADLIAVGEIKKIARTVRGIMRDLGF